jgi:hypothetical protein
MLYTSKLWNGNYLNYDMMLPKDREVRKNVHFIVLPAIFIYMLIGFCLMSVTLLFDAYRIMRYKYYKNNRSFIRLINSTYRQAIN